MATPKLRFKEFDGDWSKSNLEKTTEYFKGFAFKSESYKEDGIRIIRVSDLDRDSIKCHNEAIFLDKTEAQNYLNWEVKKKDIIITTVGSKPHLIDSAVGRPIFVKNDNEGLLNQNLLVLRPRNENIDAYFIFSQLLDKKYLTHIETIQRGNANQSNITVKDLQEFEVFQTSKEEQTKIASFLSTVDEKISQLTQKHELLSQYKRGMMQKLFSQQIRFKADDGSEFGEWDCIQANKLFENYSNKNHDGSLTILAATQDKGVVPRDEIDIDIKSSDASVLSYKIIEKGDFVISLRSFQGGIEYSNYYGICSPAYTVLKSIKPIETGFYKAYLKTNDFIQRLSSTVIGIRDGKQISYQAFSTLMIDYPCLAEQTKIANFLSAIDQKIEKVAQQIEETKQWKKGLLQQLFV
ncbi:restriction endonuclease subunit S [Acinetobacter soli]|uniref:restriction endonuclease subunit S n=1 Tax=Acinetobacter soli TaxID=487316 RepID=UPI00125FE9D3|nr:restriction endonuclease subunit S [Acinetobacter soli]